MGLSEYNHELAEELAYEIFKADPTFTTPEELAVIIEKFLNGTIEESPTQE